MKREKMKCEKLLTTAKAGKATGLSTSTILRAIKEGKIRAGRTPGGHYRIRQEDLKSVQVVTR